MQEAFKQLQLRFRVLPRQRGQALIIAILFVLAGSLVMFAGLASPIMQDVRAAGALLDGKRAWALTEGSIEDVVYRHIAGLEVSGTEVLSRDGISATTTVTDTLLGKDIEAVGVRRDRYRRWRVELTEGVGVSFNYGLQTGEGGFSMSNNSVIYGNVYSNGRIIGSNGARVAGDAVSAGATGLIRNVQVEGKAYAHRFENSTIENDCYYQEISGTTCGSLHSGSPDQAPLPMPIPDSQIEAWEDAAEAGGVISPGCSSYTISTDVTLGPAKIPCSVTIANNRKVTLTGPLWIEGNLTFNNNVEIYVDPSIGNQSVAMIVDDPSNRNTGSRIVLSNNADFIGNGDRSYVLLISQNNAAENGGGTDAILLSNNAEGNLLLYAGHGSIEVENNADVNEATAYRIDLGNNAVVTYAEGLANLIFTSGPAGGYTISEWKESQ